VRGASEHYSITVLHYNTLIFKEIHTLTESPLSVGGHSGLGVHHPRDEGYLTHCPSLTCGPWVHERPRAVRHKPSQWADTEANSPRW
jgi:hypothetical protein